MGPRRLILLRHGQAVPEGGQWQDFERPLTARGREDVATVARQLRHQNRIPDRILTSPALRTATTANIVAEQLGLGPEQVVAVDDLYLAGPETVWLQLTRCGSDWRTVLICGHNPGLSDLAGRLGLPPVRRDLATAGLATAVWASSDWGSVRPEAAEHCEPAE
jgi:phosphohistidine phosphatase